MDPCRTDSPTPDCSDRDALTAFRNNNIKEEWLYRDLIHHRPRTMAGLSELMNNYCAMEDAWLAKEKHQSVCASSIFMTEFVRCISRV